MDFNKELPGADTVFQPDDISDYRDDAWDIRISIGDSPLEEAFYFTIDEACSTFKSIRELLSNYALNPAFRDKLDVSEYPELPYIQEELIQYFENEKKGLLQLDFYINNNPDDGPVDLSRQVDKLLSVCTYHDMSHDYRVLDLVMVPEVPDTSEAEVAELHRKYAGLFLLILFDYHNSQGDKAFNKFVSKSQMASVFDVSAYNEYGVLTDAVTGLERNGCIKMPSSTSQLLVKKSKAKIVLTQKGLQEVETLKTEVAEVADDYDCFDSVSVYPCALGVPDGFDARVQMMEYDKVDPELTVLLQVLFERRDEIFNADDWYEMFETFMFYNVVKAAMAYKTNFSKEILDELKTLAEK
jgi:hypothetical protein